MIRVLGCTFVALIAGGPVALLWWGLDDGPFPYSPFFVIWFIAYAFWPEPRRVRRRAARMTPR